LDWLLLLFQKEDSQNQIDVGLVVIIVLKRGSQNQIDIGLVYSRCFVFVGAM
jgi:hypothetical protein